MGGEGEWRGGEGGSWDCMHVIMAVCYRLSRRRKSVRCVLSDVVYSKL